MSLALVPLREGDLPLVKTWRNEQMAVLRQEKPLTDEDQRRYYHDVVLPSRAAVRPALMMFSVIENGECAAYAGLTYIEWNKLSAEVVFLTKTERLKDAVWCGRVFSTTLEALKATAAGLGLKRLVMENYDARPWHLEALGKNGFRLEGRKTIVKAGRSVESTSHVLSTGPAPV